MSFNPKALSKPGLLARARSSLKMTHGVNMFPQKDAITGNRTTSKVSCYLTTASCIFTLLRMKSMHTVSGLLLVQHLSDLTG